VFGDRNDRESRVAREKAQPHAYALLASLNTRPRTTYLGAIRNPHPALAADEAAAVPNPAGPS
jgi:molybdopterin-containing oxidoreductase family iron-sulfur binding subunit